MIKTTVDQKRFLKEKLCNDRSWHSDKYIESKYRFISIYFILSFNPQAYMSVIC